jgi:hypothetical protein
VAGILVVNFTIIAVAKIFVSSVPQFRKSRIELECLRLTNCDLREIFVERIQDEIAL